MRHNPVKGHRLDDIIRHQGQALARLSHWGDIEEQAMERVERSRTRRTREKWKDVLIDAQRRRMQAEEDFDRYEQEEARLLARRERKKPSGYVSIADRKPRQYEYILKVDYKSRRTTHGTRQTFFDIRLRKEDGSRATTDELRSLTGHLKMGEVPRQWEMTSIMWDTGSREAKGEPERGPGDEYALSQLSAMIRHEKPREIGEEEM